MEGGHPAPSQARSRHHRPDKHASHPATTSVDVVHEYIGKRGRCHVQRKRARETQKHCSGCSESYLSVPHLGLAAWPKPTLSWNRESLRRRCSASDMIKLNSCQSRRRWYVPPEVPGIDLTIGLDVHLRDDPRAAWPQDPAVPDSCTGRCQRLAGVRRRLPLDSTWTWLAVK